MSVLEFIAAVKWPITVLLLAGFATWRTRRNPAWLTWLKELINKRNVRLNIGGQEFELSGTADALAAVAQSDAELVEAAEAAPGPRDVTALRREAAVQLMRASISFGWEWGKGGLPHPPQLEVSWTPDGHLEVGHGTSIEDLVNAPSPPSEEALYRVYKALKGQQRVHDDRS